MKAKCINSIGYHFLEFGKFYDVQEDPLCKATYIVNFTNYYRRCHKRLFITLEEIRNDKLNELDI